MAERKFIRLTANFDGDEKPKQALLPTDSIEAIWEDIKTNGVV